MKKRHVFAAFLALTLALTLTGCSTTLTKSSSGTASSSVKKVIIGYDGFSDTVDFSKKIHDTLAKDATASSAKLLYAESNGDAVTALKNVNTFLSQGATVIVESAWSVGAVQPVADLCKSKGIPCISIDIPVTGAYFFGANNIEAGKIGGTAAVEYINKNWGGKIDELACEFPTTNGSEVKKRTFGVEEAIVEAGITLPESNVYWMDPGSSDATTTSKQLATDFLTAHPKYTHIVFAATNDQAALGILSAIQASNRGNDCIIVSQGCDSPCITNLKGDANSWLGSVGYFPEKYGDYIIKMIQDLNAGKTISQNTYVQNIFIDKSNISKYYPQ
jgi:ribose transport system substrate-binding protein